MYILSESMNEYNEKIRRVIIVIFIEYLFEAIGVGKTFIVVALGIDTCSILYTFD